MDWPDYFWIAVKPGQTLGFHKSGCGTHFGIGATSFASQIKSARRNKSEEPKEVSVATWSLALGFRDSRL
jgi:hypothetical protein